MKLYSELASWWSVLTPEGTYDLEAEFFCALLGSEIESIMELGSGIGAMASSFPPQIRSILIDQSSDMIAQSTIRNPNALHVCACVSELYLEERVDAVLIHDSVMYMNTSAMLYEMFACAYRHLNTGGMVLVVPDVVREFFSEHSLSGGAQDGARAIQLLEWHWKPKESHNTYKLEFSVLTRDGEVVQSHHETHTLGLYSIQEFTQALVDTGFQIVEVQEEGRYFLAQKK